MNAFDRRRRARQMTAEDIARSRRRLDDEMKNQQWFNSVMGGGSSVAAAPANAPKTIRADVQPHSDESPALTSREPMEDAPIKRATMGSLNSPSVHAPPAMKKSKWRPKRLVQAGNTTNSSLKDAGQRVRSGSTGSGSGGTAGTVEHTTETSPHHAKPGKPQLEQDTEDGDGVGVGGHRNLQEETPALQMKPSLL